MSQDNVVMRVPATVLGVLVVVVCMLNACRQGNEQYLEQETWVRTVYFKVQEPPVLVAPLKLQQYDRSLIREFFLHYPPDADYDRIWLKLYGLAAYAQKDDLASVDELWRELKKIDAAPANSSSNEFTLARLTIRCREGEMGAIEAMQQFSVSSGYMAPLSIWFMALCGSEAARDQLEKIATNEQLPLRPRANAAEALLLLRDQRFLNILMKTDLLSQELPDGPWPNTKESLQMLGIVTPPKVKTLADVRVWLKKNNIRVSPPSHKVITVKGGIDWTKVDWNRSKAER